MFSSAVLLGMIALGWGSPLEAAGAARPGARVIGGSVTKIQLFPYMVSVRASTVVRANPSSPNTEEHRCGGTIISKDWVLSTTTCMDTFMNAFPTVWLRAGNTNGNIGVKYDVAKIIEHPGFKYQGDIPVNDVSLVKTSKSITFTASVKAVTLAPANLVLKAGSVVRLVGWGLTTIYGEPPTVLSDVQMETLADKECSQLYGTVAGTFCAGTLTGTKGACDGDHGGPLIYNNEQVGLLSWGNSCGRKNMPEGYTSVAHFRAWIKTETGV
ncbi:trypsin 3A1-like [Bacillus rossius redtenbacheri]|uniref:trypsin 3A1-like n=1 Tax=Bacillus rossius redtenbacheri TaxID=93214 RepID=UPI002FDD4514